MGEPAVGESVEMKGSGAKPYVIKNCGGGGWSCTCPAWRNQSIDPRVRTCKHIRKLRGDEAEAARIGAVGELPSRKPEGEAKEGPPVLLAESWDGVSSVAGWWMSEKLDGVRAWWDGSRFLSRNGNLFLAPAWFTAGLPAVPLDGELWVGRKKFTQAQGIAMSGTRGEEWRTMRYLVFDAPAHGGPFEERQRYLAGVVGGHAFASLVEQQRCRDHAHLLEEFDKVHAGGGEGLMLRQPGSLYAAGRSSTLLKMKKFHTAEAEVIGHDPGEGKHKGRCGALAVRMIPEGKVFRIGTGLKDKEREAPPPVGTIVTYKYQELTEATGVPRFPAYVGVRIDGLATPAPAKPAPVAVAKKKAAPRSAEAVALDYTEGGESRFWEASLSGARISVRFGSAGGAPKTRTYDYDSAEEARRQFADLVAEKREDGFVERGAAPALLAELPVPKLPGVRRFEFAEGSSSKFWEVWTSGSRLFTKHGKIGSGGQTTIKDFPDEAAAQAGADKLVREKAAKGYKER
ncbi:MAG: DNA ligase [Gemmataceae bacterium]|nr:DNA ligase [Gemmataceae bacterium]